MNKSTMFLLGTAAALVLLVVVSSTKSGTIPNSQFKAGAETPYGNTSIGLPDLVVYDVGFSNSTAYKGSSAVEFTFTIKNQGGATTLPSDTHVTLMKPATSNSLPSVVADLSVGSSLLGSGATKGISGSLSGTRNPCSNYAGPVSLLAKVDSTNAVAETNETNNTLTVSFTCASTAPAVEDAYVPPTTFNNPYSPSGSDAVNNNTVSSYLPTGGVNNIDTYTYGPVNSTTTFSNNTYSTTSNTNFSTNITSVTPKIISFDPATYFNPYTNTTTTATTPTSTSSSSSGGHSSGSGSNTNTTTTNTTLSGAYVYITSYLSKGVSHSLDTAILQTVLVNRGLLLPQNIVGIFGPITKASLISYQKMFNITPSIGYFGPKTMGLTNWLLNPASIPGGTPQAPILCMAGPSVGKPIYLNNCAGGYDPITNTQINGRQVCGYGECYVHL